MAINLRNVFLLSLSFLGAISITSGYSCTYRGGGYTTCRLDVVQDVLLESASTNYDYLDFLIIAKHASYPVKRSLLQFEDLQASSSCTISQAFMYVNFAYAHKASFQTDDTSPYRTHEVQLHVVNKSWLEDEATSSVRKTNEPWSASYLALDGTDADEKVLTNDIMYMGGPSRYVEFEVTDAVQKWADGSLANNGLLMKVEAEDVDGRDLRFYSNAYSDSSKHAFINVICT